MQELMITADIIQKDCADTKTNLDTISNKISQYLDMIITKHGCIPARTFYGESFTALLFTKTGKGECHSCLKAVELYSLKDKTTENFHWEFNNYAWSMVLKEADHPKIRSFLVPLKFKGTACTNWTLLRCCTQIRMRTDVAKAISDAKRILAKYQKKSGLICDAPDVRSFQYHCFSAVLLAEIYEESKEEYFLHSFEKAASFIAHFILRNGDTLYIGRGQQQSFGYGALVYLLSLAFKYSDDMKYLRLLRRVIAFLSQYQREDGSFPLVMNNIEVGYPECIECGDPRFTGWYQYNNYFDYLPFLGVFLKKAADVLTNCSCVVKLEAKELDKGYHDDDFRVVKTLNYEAVLSRPAGGITGGYGYWSNDLPIPYIVYYGKRITPSYGGEQCGIAPCTAEAIPVPLVKEKTHLKSMRSGRTWSMFFGERLIVFSFRGILIRHYVFRPTSICVEDIMIGKSDMYAYYLFEDVRSKDGNTFYIKQNVKVHSSTPLKTMDEYRSFWGGILQPMVTITPTNKNVLEFDLGHEA